MKPNKTLGYRRGYTMNNEKGFIMNDEKKENKEEFNQKEFGRQLREVRKELKVTSDRLGVACGVNPVFIRQIEAGARVPSVPVFVKICDSLQISPAYLLRSEVQIPVTDQGWEEMAEGLSQLSSVSQEMVKEVLYSLIENLGERDEKEDMSEKKYGEMDHEEFGRRLKKVRQEMQYTSQEVASNCGVSSVFIRQVELGERLPSLPVFVYLCRALQISPSYLLGNEVKVEVVECNWEELVHIQCDMTSKSQQIVKDVLMSLIRNLPKEGEEEKGV